MSARDEPIGKYDPPLWEHIGLKHRIRGRLSDVLPLLCERWCSTPWLAMVTNERNEAVIAEIKAIDKIYVVESRIFVERNNPDFLGAQTGAPGRFYRVVAPR